MVSVMHYLKGFSGWLFHYFRYFKEFFYRKFVYISHLFAKSTSVVRGIRKKNFLEFRQTTFFVWRHSLSGSHLRSRDLRAKTNQKNRDREKIRFLFLYVLMSVLLCYSYIILLTHDQACTMITLGHVRLNDGSEDLTPHRPLARSHRSLTWASRLAECS